MTLLPLVLLGLAIVFGLTWLMRPARPSATESWTLDLTDRPADATLGPGDHVLVQGFVGDALVLQTVVRRSERLSLPLEPLRQQRLVGGREHVQLRNGELTVHADRASLSPDGEAQVLTTGPLVLRFEPHRDRPEVRRVAPLPIPELTDVPPLRPGATNPFPALYDAWRARLSPERRALGESRGWEVAERFPPFVPQAHIPPIQAGQTELELFHAAGGELLFDDEAGPPSMGIDTLESLPGSEPVHLGGDGTGDGLIGVTTRSGDCALFWVGHDPFGVFYRGPAMRVGLAEAITHGDPEDIGLSAMHPFPSAPRLTAVPPCYLDGDEELVARLQAQTPSAPCLDFRGQPVGCAYEEPHAWPKEIIDGQIVVLHEEL